MTDSDFWRHARHDLDVIRTIAQRHHTNLNQLQDNVDIALHPPRPETTGRGASELTPTEAQAAMYLTVGIGEYGRRLTAIRNALELVDSWFARQQRHTTTPDEYRTSRCDGGGHEWAQPTCEEYALVDTRTGLPKARWIEGEMYFLCARCWARGRQHEARKKAS